MTTIQPHATDGFSIQDADKVTLRDCRLKWGEHLTTAGVEVGQVRVNGLNVEILITKGTPNSLGGAQR
jgi:hypothetical protein